jgi:hypothetical protein
VLASLVFDNVSEGKDVLLGMLIVGLIFVGVIALGECAHALNSRRKKRRALRPPTY